MIHFRESSPITYFFGGCMTSNQIKLIAIIAMTVDHLAWTFFEGYSSEWYAVAAHVIGRITAPIMCFFIAEGYYHTRNVKKYALRLFLLAFISHFAYNFCFGISLVPFVDSVFNQTGVVWSLAFGLLLLCINDSKKLSGGVKLMLTLGVCVVTFPGDWSCVAAMMVLFMGIFRGDFKKQMMWMVILSFSYATVYFLFLDRLYGVIQLATCLSIPILKLYNGERGRSRIMGKVFYFYYPAHLALCGILRLLIRG